MAEDEHPAQPRSLTLMAGPVDCRVNPTGVNELAISKPIDSMPKEFRRRAKGELAQWYVDQEAQTGKPPSRDEAMKFIADQFLQGQADGWFSDTPRTRIEARMRDETFIAPKDAPAPSAAAPAPKPSGLVWMREPPRSDGKPQRMLLVPPGKVAELEAKGAKVVQR